MVNSRDLLEICVTRHSGRGRYAKQKAAGMTDAKYCDLLTRMFHINFGASTSTLVRIPQSNNPAALVRQIHGKGKTGMFNA